MMEESATIVRTEGEYAWVSAQPSQGCGACAANGSCGTGALSRVLGRREVLLKVPNTLRGHAGDAVILGIGEQELLRGALLVYLLPLLAMMAGAMLADMLGGHPAWPILGGTAGFFASIRWIKKSAAVHGRSGHLQPVMLRLGN